MNPAEINLGDRLLLKREAQKRYGLTDPVVTVCNIYTRKGYKVPWIVGVNPGIDTDNGEGAFKPSDFARAMKETATEANARVATLGRRKVYS